MASKKTTSEPAPIAGLDPLAILTIETLLSRVAIRFASAQHARGPVDLQALWCDVAKAALRCNHVVDDATKIADRVVADFVSRAESLATMTAQLPYFDPTDEAEGDGAEGE